MPRRSPLSERGRRFLRGPRLDVKHRPFRPPLIPVRPLYIGSSGQPLNAWESIVAWALVDLGIEFEDQAILGSPRTLGGANVDFLLRRYGIALEVQGPFHNTTAGKVRDFYRRANRAWYGFRLVEVAFEDLAHIHTVLRRIVGYAVVAAVEGR